MSWYRIDIDTKVSTNRWHLSGQVALGRVATVTLYGPAGKKLLQRQTDRLGKFSVPDLGLEAGSYMLELSGAKTGSVRIVSLKAGGTAVAGQESEPNDKPAQANRVDFSTPVRGRSGDKGDADRYLFSSDGVMAYRIHRLVLASDSEHRMELCLGDSQDSSIQCQRGSGTLVLPGLLLTPGHWSISAGRMEAD